MQLLLVGSFVFSSVCFSPDYTRIASEIAGNCGDMLSLRDASLVAQEPSPVAGAAEDVWRDSESIHPIASNCTIAGIRSAEGWLVTAAKSW